MQTNNKYKINSWRTVLFLLLVLSFTGCSKEHIGVKADKNAITFDCSTKSLRVAETTVDNMQYFRVSAVWDKAGMGYESFMNNQLVEKQGNNWVYSPVKHWPGYGAVSFFAYSPAASSGVGLIELDTSANRIFIKYTVSDNFQQQEDFLVATSIDKSENPVQLKFEHALSMVKFQARSNNIDTTFRIKKIKLTNVYSEGSITEVEPGVASTWECFEHLFPKEYVVYQQYPFETQGVDYAEIGSLVVLPQQCTYLTDPDKPNIGIEIEYDIVGTSQSGILEYILEDEFEFALGKRYTFFLSLSTADKKKSTTTSPYYIDLHIVSEDY